MDNQNQQPLVRVEPESPPQPVVAPVPTTVTPEQTGKPKLDVSDEAAQALLMINGIQAGQRQKTKLPVTLIISIVVVILLAILSSALLGKAKTGVSTSSNSTNSGATSQSEDGGSSSVDKQINQDVNSCANPVNAVSDC